VPSLAIERALVQGEDNLVQAFGEPAQGRWGSPTYQSAPSDRRVAQPVNFLETSMIEGAPSLRFLQGRVRCCQHHVVLGSGNTRPSLQASVVPALRTEREGRGTLFLACASEFKSLGHPPIKLASMRAARTGPSQ
jgi:hypothetical protein